jgi:hypothetical protein
MTFNNIIGVGGLAGSGKDTFVNLLQSKIPNVQRFALADSLKAELNPTLINLYNTDIFTCSREQKDIVRPVLVAHGKVRRTLSEGRHWIEILNNKISEHREKRPEDIICITDVRYDVFKRDEVNWLKQELGGCFVHITRYDIVAGKNIPQQPPNADEAENDPKLQAKANYRVIWPSAKKVDGTPDFNSLNIYVEEFIKWLRR